MDDRGDLDQIWQNDQNNDRSVIDAFTRAPIITISTQAGKSTPNKSPFVPLKEYYTKERKTCIRTRIYGKNRRQSSPSISSSCSHSDDQTDESIIEQRKDARLNRKRKLCNHSSDSSDEYAIIPHKNKYKEGISECFLCSWGNLYHDGIEAPKINRLSNIIKNNYGKHNNEDIAQQLHLYFKHEIYDPKRGMVMLTVETALEHLEFHCNDATIYVGESIKRLRRLDSILENKIVREDETYDRNALADLHKNMSLGLRYYKENIERLNFVNGGTKDDQKGTSNYFNMLEPFLENDGNTRYNAQMQKTQDIRAIRL